MNKELAATLIFTIEAIRKTKHGGIKLTLEIPPQEAPKAMALALREDTLFSADIFIDSTVFGAKSAIGSYEEKI